jgi:hypothetical protein
MEQAQEGVSLQEWLEASEMTYHAFARLIPCSRSYPRTIALGLRRPSYEMAIRIEEVTGGLVPRTRWYPAGPKLEPKVADHSIEELFGDD